MNLDRQHYAEDFGALDADGLPEYALRMRREAFDCFQSMQFPTTHQEEWRFTNLAPLIKIPFRDVSRPSRRATQWEEIAPFVPAAQSDSRLVFVNGKLAMEMSRLPEGFLASGIAEGLRSGASENYLCSCVRFQKNAFTALNTAFLRDGAFLFFPNDFTAPEPIHLIHVTAQAEDTVAHPRNLIVLSRGARASVVESYVNISGTRTFTNAVTEVVLANNSALQHIKIQRESEAGFHIATTHARQNRDSSYSCLTVTLGAAISREDLSVTLENTGADSALNGIYLTDRSQHADHHTTIDHARPHGTSRELYKGILGGQSRAVFNGRIIVRKDAQHTNARQTNRNILLSQAARVNTTPQLEISADDVKCSHGATIGHLDEDALFYLQSRGISTPAARAMLMHGFLQELTMTIPQDDLRESLDAVLLSRLAEFAGVQS